jgi:hypothetical protein
MCDGIADLELADKVPKDKEGREIEDGCPKFCLERRQHFVETIVAIEMAASWNPFMYSNTNANNIMVKRKII